MEPIVYLPVEVKYREMPSRMLIACHLIQAGYAVVLGSHWGLISPPNQAALPPGLFLFKSVNRIQGNAMRSLRAHGHAVAASDEEVLVFIEDRGYTVAFSEISAGACQLFFAQSKAHMRAVENRFPQLKGKIRVVGNPRIDLMSPKNRALFHAVDDRVEALKPYVLFNTNYGTINSVWADSNRVMVMAETTGTFDGPDREKKKKEFQAIMDWETGNLKAMVALLQWTLNAAKGLNCVVRPHPAERPSHWEKMLAGVPRAHVIPRSDPHPWILGAELVVHTGCTTGLEAVLLDKAALNLLPEDHPNARQIVTQVNPTFRTWEKAAEAMAAYLTTRGGPIAAHADKTAAALAKHLPSYRDDAAAQLIAESLGEELMKLGAAPRADFMLNWRGAFAEPERSEIHKDKYTATEDEVRAGIEKAAEMAGITVKPRLSTIGDGLFLVTGA
ncbi:MAG: surface carbohydrate biosynthesis protein [Rhodospirillaceae bacterium]